jgi:hypothetical protein
VFVLQCEWGTVCNLDEKLQLGLVPFFFESFTVLVACMLCSRSSGAPSAGTWSCLGGSVDRCCRSCLGL